MSFFGTHRQVQQNFPRGLPQGQDEWFYLFNTSLIFKEHGVVVATSAIQLGSRPSEDAPWKPHSRTHRPNVSVDFVSHNTRYTCHFVPMNEQALPMSVLQIINCAYA